MGAGSEGRIEDRDTEDDDRHIERCREGDAALYGRERRGLRLDDERRT
ncbi:hypothetical protein [Haloarchaeobius sp. FL176]|nr:hypothetical protein [Haloarchaeobius sp. FL176]